MNKTIAYIEESIKALESYKSQATSESHAKVIQSEIDDYKKSIEVLKHTKSVNEASE